MAEEKRSSQNATKRSGNRMAYIAMALIAAAIVANVSLALVDEGEANIIGGLLFISGVTLGWFWLWRRRSLPLWMRGLSFALPFLGIALVMALSEFRGFSGTLVPQFKWRQSVMTSSKTASPEAARREEASNSNEKIDGSFVQFLGNNRNGIIEDVAIDPDWTNNPPKLIWKKAIGPGWSGIVVRENLAVTLEEFEGADTVTAFWANDGEVCWRQPLARQHYHPLGGRGPRATPTIDGDYVYIHSSTGIVACLKFQTGDLVWKVDLLELLQVSQSEIEAAVTWGRSGSPLIDGDRLIVPLGGKSGASAGGLIAFEKSTGKELWRGGTGQISYSSPTKIQLRNREQIVIVNEATISGHEPETGVVLWEYKWPGQSNGGASVSQPISIDDNRLFVSKGYHVGCALLDFSKSLPNTPIVTTVWSKSNLMKTKFTNPVFREGYVYGLSDGVLECLRVEDGKQMWKDSRNGRFGHGQLLLVGEHLLIATEEGQCALATADPTASRIHGTIEVLEGITWNSMTLVGSHVFMRNGEEVACVRLPVIPIARGPAE